MEVFPSVLGCLTHGVLLLSALCGQTTSLPALSREESNLQDLLAEPQQREIEALAEKQWTLEECSNGIEIRLGGRLLSQKSFYCTMADAEKLAPMLNGESLRERMYVWCRTALLYHSLDPNATVFEVENLNYFDGDIVLTRDTVDSILASFFPTPGVQTGATGALQDKPDPDSKGRSKRKIATDRSNQWPDAVVPFRIFFKGFQRGPIYDAIAHWEENTCIRFSELGNTPRTRGRFTAPRPTLIFVTGKGCGYLAGRRFVMLGTYCFTRATIAHEIGHALGFFHEHNRPDRDRYVTIRDNIQENRRPQFVKQSWDKAVTYGIPYDYSSVMHYNSDAFASNASRTILTTDPEMENVIGQNEGLSFLDIKIANYHYCSDRCSGNSLEWTECKNGGYRNPTDCSSCLCPRGLAPPRCEEPAPGVKADCDRQTLQASGSTQHLSSPGYHDDGFPPGAVCSWLIKTTSPGKQIQLRFAGRFSFTEHKHYICLDYVEIRYKGLSRPGPRFCGSDMPQKIFPSHSDDILILTYSRATSTTVKQVFQVEYKEEYCGGCSVDARDGEIPCLRVAEFLCNPSVADIPCYREEKFCCDGYRLEDDRCKRSSRSTAASTTVASKATTARNQVSSTTPFPTTTTPFPTTTTPFLTTTPFPKTTTPHPTTMTPLSATTTELPKTTTPIPATTTQLPTTTTPLPATKTQLPTTTTPLPATTTQLPTTTTPHPTTTTQLPTTITSLATTTRTPLTTTTTPRPTTTPLPAITADSNRRGWGPWGEWTACSGSCGLCGRQSRHRTCRGRDCLGGDSDTRRCANSVCLLETKSEICWRRGPGCRFLEFSCYEKYACPSAATKSRCCAGTPANGICRT